MTSIAFEQLIEKVNECSRCERMERRKAVLGSQCGDLNSKILFIAEAPGRLGADHYRIPLWGDQTGKNFEYLLDSISYKRDSIFITNAVLCNPRNEFENNSTPLSQEIRNCSVFLNQLINIIKPQVIVTLGNTALDALRSIEPHSIKLNQQVGTPQKWGNCIVFPLYHPSPQATNRWRSRELQSSDFHQLALFVQNIISVY